MGVFHVFQIVQMVPNRVTHHNYGSLIMMKKITRALIFYFYLVHLKIFRNRKPKWTFTSKILLFEYVPPLNMHHPRLSAELKILSFEQLDGTIEASGDAIDNVVARIRNEWSKVEHLPLSLTSRVLLVGAKCGLYITSMCIVKICGSQTLPVKEDDVIQLERNDTMVVRWMRKVRPKDKISAGETQNMLSLNILRECLHNRLQWFCHLENLIKSSCSRKCWQLEVVGSLARGSNKMI